MEERSWGKDKALLLFSSCTQPGQTRGSFPGLYHKERKEEILSARRNT